MMRVMDPLKEFAGQEGILLTDGQLDQFSLYMSLLLEWNQKMNLTAITQPEQIIVRHFLDSLLLFRYFPQKENSSLIDVGTGAGFPGIPLKIWQPSLSLTLLDSLNKRLLFLREVCGKLGVSANLVHSRAEEGALKKEFRERFDLATARAVASMPLLCEYCLPYVRVGGKMILMKGPECGEEVSSAAAALKLLGGEIEEIREYQLPDGSGRTLIAVRKVRRTPAQYPRHGSKIAKSPL